MKYEYYYGTAKAGEIKPVDFNELTKDKCQWICENLIAIPSVIGITYETIPALVHYNQKKYLLERYRSYESTEEYMRRNAEDIIAALQGEIDHKDEPHPKQLWENHRLIVCIWGHTPDAKRRDGELSPITLNYDFQELSSSKIGVLQSHMGLIFLHFIAPLAMLVPDTWEMSAMRVLPSNDYHAQMKHYEGITDAAMEIVWNTLCGEVSSDTPMAHSAARLLSSTWEWRDGEVGEISKFWCDTIDRFFAFCDEKYGKDTVTGWRGIANHTDAWIRDTYKMNHNEDEDDD